MESIIDTTNSIGGFRYDLQQNKRKLTKETYDFIYSEYGESYVFLEPIIDKTLETYEFVNFLNDAVRNGLLNDILAVQIEYNSKISNYEILSSNAVKYVEYISELYSYNLFEEKTIGVIKDTVNLFNYDMIYRNLLSKKLEFLKFKIDKDNCLLSFYYLSEEEYKNN